MSNNEVLPPSVSKINPSSPKQHTLTNPQTSSPSPTVSPPKEPNPTTSSPKPAGLSRTRKKQIPKKFVPTSTSSEKPNSEESTPIMPTSHNLETSVNTTENDDGMEAMSQGVETEDEIEKGDLREIPPDSGNPTSLANLDISGVLDKSVATGDATKDSVENVVATKPENS
ncbi:uncharacterized protein LOC132041792 [Lycium ferocissimum]|uniref:uncharacterized protein LOC132041792 n=1 Tax=Lycium ferocissimum TaxID=112874 RepID=UPI00281614AE|nr:uncharacterized protein LOC132041792 [Lycium ferocissimum]